MRPCDAFHPALNGAQRRGGCLGGGLQLHPHHCADHGEIVFHPVIQFLEQKPPFFRNCIPFQQNVPDKTSEILCKQNDQKPGEYVDDDPRPVAGIFERKGLRDRQDVVPSI